MLLRRSGAGVFDRTDGLGQALATLFAPEWLAPQNELLALKRAGVAPELVAAARERNLSPEPHAVCDFKAGRGVLWRPGWAA